MKIFSLCLMLFALILGNNSMIYAQNKLKKNKYILKLSKELQPIAIKEMQLYCDCYNKYDIDLSDSEALATTLEKDINQLVAILDAKKSQQEILPAKLAMFASMERLEIDNISLENYFKDLNECADNKASVLTEEELKLSPDVQAELDKIRDDLIQDLDKTDRMEKQYEMVNEIFSFCPNALKMIQFTRDLEDLQQRYQNTVDYYYEYQAASKDHPYIQKLPEELRLIAFREIDMHCDCVHEDESDLDKINSNLKTLDGQIAALDASLDANDLEKAKRLRRQLDLDSEEMAENGVLGLNLEKHMKKCVQAKKEQFSSEENELIVEAKKRINEIIYKDLNNPTAEGMLKRDREVRKAIYHYCPKMVKFLDFSAYISTLREVDNTVLEKYRNKTGED